MTQKKSNHGGARPGAGRKPRQGPKPRNISIQLPEDAEKLWFAAKRKLGLSNSKLAAYLLAK